MTERDASPSCWDDTTEAPHECVETVTISSCLAGALLLRLQVLLYTFEMPAEGRRYWAQLLGWLQCEVLPSMSEERLDNLDLWEVDVDQLAAGTAIFSTAAATSTSVSRAEPSTQGQVPGLTPTVICLGDDGARGDV